MCSTCFQAAPCKLVSKFKIASFSLPWMAPLSVVCHPVVEDRDEGIFHRLDGATR